MFTVSCRLYAALALLLALACSAAPPDYGRVELLRDTWGIPHVFSDTDRGAMYGLGYATAQERGFQMTYGLRIMQGRLAEVIGDRQKAGRRETALDNDRKMRTFGWARAAARIASNLDADTRGLLEAYCEGVNDSFAAQQKAGTLHPLFKKLEVTPEKWTPADCLLSWWHVAQFFAGDGTRDLMVWHNRLHPQPGQPPPPQPGASWADDTAAVVQRQDVSESWLREVEQFCSAHGLSGAQAGDTNETPKFSHAWVVGGKKTTTGSAVLVSDPQTPVRNPSLWMEFHVQGKSFDARGIGMPGSPGLLIGFNQACGVGPDRAGRGPGRPVPAGDLSRASRRVPLERPMAQNGGAHRKDRGEGRRTNGVDDPRNASGPGGFGVCFPATGRPRGGLEAGAGLRNQSGHHPGVFAMMRAQDAEAFQQALGRLAVSFRQLRLWRCGGPHRVCSARGDPGAPAIGRRTQVEARPCRERVTRMIGRVSFRPLCVPQVRGPAPGFLLSANHRPIGSFYPVPLGTSTGSMGDTIRSWRLRERLSAKERFSPADVLDVHYDTVNPARREIVRLGLHLRDTQPDRACRMPSLKALAALEKWLAAGASSDLRSEHAELATRLSTFFRFVVTPLARKYGGGESGLARFLKDASSRMSKDPKARFDEDECGFIDKVLSEAWSAGECRGKQRARLARASERELARQNPPMGWFDSLDGFGSLDPARILRRRASRAWTGRRSIANRRSPTRNGCRCTTWTRRKRSARLATAIGRTAVTAPARWNCGESAKLHPAPLSREAVEKIAARKIHAISAQTGTVNRSSFRIVALLDLKHPLRESTKYQHGCGLAARSVNPVRGVLSIATEPRKCPGSSARSVLSLRMAYIPTLNSFSTIQ